MSGFLYHLNHYSDRYPWIRISYLSLGSFTKSVNQRITIIKFKTQKNNWMNCKTMASRIRQITKKFLKSRKSEILVRIWAVPNKYKIWAVSSRMWEFNMKQEEETLIRVRSKGSLDSNHIWSRKANRSMVELYFQIKEWRATASFKKVTK